MPLFENSVVTDVVNAEDIRAVTGIGPNDIRYIDRQDEQKEEKLNQLLNTWIDRIASHIHVRLGRSITEDSSEFLAIQDVIVRTVSKLVAVSQQLQSSPIVQIGDYAVSVLNTAEVTKDLDAELKPFLKNDPNRAGRISFFSSITDDDLIEPEYDDFYWYRVGDQGSIQGAFAPYDGSGNNEE